MKKYRMALPFLICIFSFVVLYQAYRYYAPPKLRRPYPTPLSDDTLRIAYIGDSWAFLHKNFDRKIARLLEDSLSYPVRIYSYGACGLTSKEIYENLYNNQGLKTFFQKRGYDYCVVFAGINDSYKKMGISYYKKSIEGIIQFLLYNHIHPIIIEIPDYDIHKAYERQTLLKKMLRHISMIISGKAIDCKQEYRDALRYLLTESKYIGKVTILSYKSWNNDYIKNQKVIYCNDGMHLNDKGYLVLDCLIIQKLRVELHVKSKLKVDIPPETAEK